MHKGMTSAGGARAAMLAGLGMASLLGPAPGALAAPLPGDELARECWQRHTRERTRVNLREPTAVDFSNLARGQRLRSPFQVDFAVRGMGVVPAGQAVKGAGHHHILVNKPLPLNIGAPIPFSDTHRHFGKGQTGTVLDLPPGTHRLRLLFADHEHRPYFVYSPEVEVVVTGARSEQPLPLDRRDFEAQCPAWYEDELARPRPPGEALQVLNLRDGEAVVSPFNLRFGVDGFGIAAAGTAVDKTGHFAYELRQGGRLLRGVALDNGATQTNLGLAPGAYQLRLRLLDSTGARDLLPALDFNLLVSAQERL